MRKKKKEANANQMEASQYLAEKMEVDEEVFEGEDIPGTSNWNRRSRNMTKIDNVALASLRYWVQDWPIDAIASVVLQDYGVIDASSMSQIMDTSKVKRVKQRVMEQMQECGAAKYKEYEILCLFFDGRTDLTKVMEFNEETGKFYAGKKMEEHYSSTVEK